MGLFSRSTKINNDFWESLETEEQLDSFNDLSNTKTVIFLKHSTRCSISIMAKTRLDSQWEVDENISMVYLDLLKYRPLSNLLESKYNVRHASPQVLVIKNGICTYATSHSDINARTLKKEA